MFNPKFHRIFSKSMYKNLKLPLGEMTFTKDFVNDRRGDLYPLLQKSSDCVETVADNRYKVCSGCAERMFTQFFPYATYEITFSTQQGYCGFSFHLPTAKAEILIDENTVSFTDTKTTESACLVNSSLNVTMIVSCRPAAFDVYFLKNGQLQYFHTFRSDPFADANAQQQFKNGYVSVIAKGEIVIDQVSSYIDCGISQADIRAVHYENGDPIFENGKLYFSATIRMQEGGFQGIFAWTPSTSQITLTGALFFDCGDGFWRNYLASSLLYHRETRQWYIWTSSFEHKHILCYAAFHGEPRFGVNVIDVTMMRAASDEPATAFVGFPGDEDPDFYHNAQENQWYMAICRVCPITKKYRYMFFQSDNPFSGYTYIGQGYDGSETGGSFVKIHDEMAFVCGNGFEKRANYRIYTKAGMREAAFDFDDGGFRGWGTVIPIEMGSRKRYFWLTFDRHNGSTYNWSYGNIYCFEAVE